VLGAAVQRGRRRRGCGAGVEGRGLEAIEAQRLHARQPRHPHHLARERGQQRLQLGVGQRLAHRLVGQRGGEERLP
jgi:hypothetical protein